MFAKKTVPLSCVLLTLFSSAVWAGPNTSGGGNTINNRLAELSEHDPRTLPGFREAALPAINRAKRLVPEFGLELERQLEALSWNMVPRKLIPLAPEKTGLRFESEQAAYQDNGEVWIDRNRFFALAPRSQGGLIVHELVMAALGHADPTDQDHASVRKVTRMLLSEKSPNEGDLMFELSSRGFGHFETGSEKVNLDAKWSRLHQSWVDRITRACSAIVNGPNFDEIRKQATLEINSVLFEEMRGDLTRIDDDTIALMVTTGDLDYGCGIFLKERGRSGRSDHASSQITAPDIKVSDANRKILTATAAGADTFRETGKGAGSAL